MANSWNIPSWLEKEVRARDKNCVYCGIAFTTAKISKKTCASWEHIIMTLKSLLSKTLLYAAAHATQAKGKNSYLHGFFQNTVLTVKSRESQWPQ